MEDIAQLKNQVVTNNICYDNPFPGLRPFEKDDSHLFFGRENHIDDVLKKLIDNRFIAIVGNSGIGKSSFINCGILPKLYSDNFGYKSMFWDIVTFRPGINPLKSLSAAFYQLYKSNPDIAGFIKDEDFLRNLILSNGINGFVDFISRLEFYTKNNILIYVDQFEEIFRNSRSEAHNADETKLFLDILISSSRISLLSINVIITMRSDFVGDCSKYPNLTKAINDSQFLIPQMTRDEKRIAIEGPIKVMGAQICDKLVNEILNKLGDADDQLPIMQHALMRTWEYWSINKIGNQIIDMSHYTAIGGMDAALSIHANEIFNELRPELQPICEKIFKNITEKGEEGRTIRRPATVLELSEIAQTTPKNIIDVVDCFRKQGRTILTPSQNVPLTQSSIVDVSHESIMRIWLTLSQWVDKEYESVKQYLRIAEAAELHQNKKGGLMKPPELQMAINWKEEQNPNKTWGIRHNVAYDRTIEYLDFSETQFLREQRLKAQQQKRRLIIARVVAGVFATGAVIAMLFFIYAQKQKQVAVEKTILAEQQSVIAKKNAAEAKTKAEEAKKSAEEARKQSLIAEQEKINALMQTKLAKQSAIIAENESRKALAQEKIANAAKDTAEQAKLDALRMRMLSISKSMAVKSLQEGELVTKALVAKQSHNFFVDNLGEGTDPDIYQALYDAVKKLKGNDFNSLPGHNDNIRAIVSVPNSEDMYSASSDGKILKWKKNDKFKFNQSQVYQNPNTINKALAISNDGKFMVAGGNYPYLLIFNLKKDSLAITKVKINVTEIWDLAFTPDSKNIIYVSSDNRVMKYDFKNVSEIKRFDRKINSFDISNDYLAVGSTGGIITVFDLKNNFTESLYYTDPQTKDITSLKFSENGKMLAVGTIVGTVQILDTKQKTVVTSLKGHTGMINKISFNHSGAKLATASFDHTVRIWDLNNLHVQPVVFSDHDDWVWSIAFTKDDTHLLAGCRDNIVRAWLMDVNDLSNFICTDPQITRDLSSKEWANYVGKDIKQANPCTK